MSKVQHRFGLWVECADCEGKGVRPGMHISFVSCERCSGNGYVPLIVTPPEMAALLAGGHVDSVPSGQYRVLTQSGEEPEAAPAK